MNKNKFFEKVGKLTFSVLLTWILVSWIVIAASGTWDTYNDSDIVTWTEWQKMVNSIKNKVNAVNLQQYYTKTESDDKFLTEVNIPTIVMDFNTLQWSSALSHKVTKPKCTAWYSPKIQVNLDWYLTVGDVDHNDIIWTRIEDKWTYWNINGWDYDCWKFVGQKIVKWCGRNNTSRVSYTSYCVSVQRTAPVCWSSQWTCDVWIASSNYAGTWVCTEGSIKKTCWTPTDPCDSPRPPRYCNWGEIQR